jgi:hypothetical protein
MPSAGQAPAENVAKLTFRTAMEKAAALAAGKTTIREFNLAYLKALRELVDKEGMTEEAPHEEREGDILLRMRESPYKED